MTKLSLRLVQKRVKMTVQRYLPNFAGNMVLIILNIRTKCWFLGVIAKLRKATVSFVMSVRLSVRPHQAAGLQRDRFSRNSIFEDFFSENL